MNKSELFDEQVALVSPEVKMEMDWSCALVERINQTMESKGLSHRALAKSLGCHESQITRWTTGFPNFTLNALARLSVALETDLLRGLSEDDV